MKKSIIFVHDKRAGVLSENTTGGYEFTYDDNYEGEQVSLTMPLTNKTYSFVKFPSFFENNNETASIKKVKPMPLKNTFRYKKKLVLNNLEIP